MFIRLNPYSCFINPVASAARFWLPEVSLIVVWHCEGQMQIIKEV